MFLFKKKVIFSLSKFKSRFKQTYFSLKTFIKKFFKSKDVYFFKGSFYPRKSILYFLLRGNRKFRLKDTSYFSNKDNISISSIENINYDSNVEVLPLHSAPDLDNFERNFKHNVDRRSGFFIVYKYYFDINIIDIFSDILDFFTTEHDFKIKYFRNREFYNLNLWPIQYPDSSKFKKSLELLIKNINFITKSSNIDGFLHKEFKEILFRKHSSFIDSNYIDNKISFSTRTLNHFR